ncbi:hypothetical protein [Kitasatospora sp. NPDC054795]
MGELAAPSPKHRGEFGAVHAEEGHARLKGEGFDVIGELCVGSYELFDCAVDRSGVGVLLTPPVASLRSECDLQTLGVVALTCEGKVEDVSTDGERMTYLGGVIVRGARADCGQAVEEPRSVQDVLRNTCVGPHGIDLQLRQ